MKTYVLPYQLDSEKLVRLNSYIERNSNLVDGSLRVSVSRIDRGYVDTSGDYPKQVYEGVELQLADDSWEEEVEKLDVLINGPKNVLDVPIEALGLSSRIYRVFRQFDIETIRHIVGYSEDQLLSIKNFGMTSLLELKQALAHYGVSLKGEFCDPTDYRQKWTIRLAEDLEDRPKDVLDLPIEELRLSRRAYNSLKRRFNVKTIRDITRYSRTDILDRNHIGKLSLAEIEEVLAVYGISLKDYDYPIASMQATRKLEVGSILDKPIEELELGRRALIGCDILGIKNVRDLVKTTEGKLLSVKNVGEFTVNQIRRALFRHRLVLREEA